jgi:hypothetical protein
MPTILFKRFRHDVWHHPSFFLPNALPFQLERITLQTLGDPTLHVWNAPDIDPAGANGSDGGALPEWPENPSDGG